MPAPMADSHHSITRVKGVSVKTFDGSRLRLCNLVVAEKRERFFVHLFLSAWGLRPFTVFTDIADGSNAEGNIYFQEWEENIAVKEESEHMYGCLGTFGEGGQFYPNRGQWLPLFHFLLPKGSSSCMSCSSQGPIYCPHLTDFQQNHLEFCAGDRWKTLSSFTPPNGDPPHPFRRMTERLASLRFINWPSCLSRL